MDSIVAHKECPPESRRRLIAQLLKPTYHLMFQTCITHDCPALFMAVEIVVMYLRKCTTLFKHTDGINSVLPHTLSAELPRVYLQLAAFV